MNTNTDLDLRVLVGTIVDPMDVATAESTIAQIDTIRGAAYAQMLPHLVALYRGQAWKSLGFASWKELCDERLGSIRLPVIEREAAIKELHSAGMTIRPIADVVRVSPATVGNVTKDLPSNETPKTGVDNKTRKAKRQPTKAEQKAKETAKRLEKAHKALSGAVEASRAVIKADSRVILGNASEGTLFQLRKDIADAEALVRELTALADKVDAKLEAKAKKEEIDLDSMTDSEVIRATMAAAQRGWKETA